MLYLKITELADLNKFLFKFRVISGFLIGWKEHRLVLKIVLFPAVSGIAFGIHSRLCVWIHSCIPIEAIPVWRSNFWRIFCNLELNWRSLFFKCASGSLKNALRYDIKMFPDILLNADSCAVKSTALYILLKCFFV